MKNIFYLPFLIVLLNVGAISSQNLPLHDFLVVVNGTQLKNAWAGGMKSSQFSSADLDNDGEQDLFIFDKTGDVVMTFKNDGIAGSPEYSYAPDLAKNFPKLQHWALLRDFNNDGAMDIFGQLTGTAIQGVAVWKGRWEGNRLSFDRIEFPQLSINAIPVPSGNGDFTQLYISTQDVPGIVDMDDDGDMDILTFGPVGGVVYLYQNMDVENQNSLETFEFVRADDCWGKFFESGVIGCLELSDDPNNCQMGRSGPALHAGSTLAVFDGDSDGDKDLVLGDVSFFNLIYAENSETNNAAWINSQDCEFPNYDVSVDLVAFPAPYVLDLNNDGERDLVVTPNTFNNGEDRFPIWYYQNQGTDLSPEFRFVSQQFLLEGMIDVGSGANPTFVDYNADGLLDLVVGNHSYWLTGGQKDSRLQLFMNTGSAENPEFELTDDDFLGFKDLFFTSSNIYNFVPDFGDIDDDGDEDLIVGDNSGRLIFVENIAGPNVQMEFTNPIYDWMQIKVGTSSTPGLVDVNRDGLMDIVIGERNINFIDYTDTSSSFNLYLNVGSEGNPFFNPSPNTAPNNPFFGFAVTADNGLFTGESAPEFYDTGDSLLMFSGSTSGKIKVYSNIIDNLDGHFDLVENDYGNLKAGWLSRVAVADINNDDILDMVVGNRRGGMQFVETRYKTDGSVISKTNLLSQNPIKVYPNPSPGLISVEIPEHLNSGRLELWSIDGSMISSQMTQGVSNQVNLDNFSKGIYILKWYDEKGNYGVEKVVVF